MKTALDNPFPLHQTLPEEEAWENIKLFQYTARTAPRHRLNVIIHPEITKEIERIHQKAADILLTLEEGSKREALLSALVGQVHGTRVDIDVKQLRQLISTFNRERLQREGIAIYTRDKTLLALGSANKTIFFPEPDSPQSQTNPDHTLMEELEKQLAETTDRAEKAEARAFEASFDIEELIAQLDKAAKTIRKLREDLAAAKKQEDQSASTIKTLTKDLAAAKTQEDQSASTIKTLTKDLAAAKKQEDQSTKMALEFKKQASAAEAELARLRSSLQELPATSHKTTPATQEKEKPIIISLPELQQTIQALAQRHLAPIITRASIETLAREAQEINVQGSITPEQLRNYLSIIRRFLASKPEDSFTYKEIARLYRL